MAWKVLVTARAFWVSGQKAQEALEAAGCRVSRSPQAGPLPEADLIALLQGCDAIIASSDPYNAHIFSACPQLKIVARCGVGIDSVDLEAATQAGVVITNTPGAMTEAVGDYTIGLMLGIARRIAEADALVRAGGWGEFRGTLISGKTLGLVGVGRIGQAVAQRAAGFNMRLLAYDPPLEASLKSDPNFTADMLPMEFVELDDLLAQSDFVSLHAPNTPGTVGMFDAGRFSQMKPTAYFINTARGALVNETDLLAALTEGKIAGAAVDVYSQEPLPADHPLRSAPNSLLTPHNAFNAIEATETMSHLCAKAILALQQGGHPDSVCNPAVWDSSMLRTRV
jgi:D-3-phosphoglycerate dehydrogenase